MRPGQGASSAPQRGASALAPANPKRLRAGRPPPSAGGHQLASRLQWRRRRPTPPPPGRLRCTRSSSIAFERFDGAIDDGPLKARLPKHARKDDQPQLGRLRRCLARLRCLGCDEAHPSRSARPRLLPSCLGGAACAGPPRIFSSTCCPRVRLANGCSRSHFVAQALASRTRSRCSFRSVDLHSGETRRRIGCW